MHPNKPVSAGELIKTFRYGKALVVNLVILGIVFLALTGFIMYLSATALDDEAKKLVPKAVALLVVLAIVMFGLAVWQRKLRQAVFDIHEKGVFYIVGQDSSYVPFAEMEDVFLFSSGNVGGMVNNLAYRRNATESYVWAAGALKEFFDFQELFCALHLNARFPLAVEKLESGRALTFNYLSTGEVWRKRLGGNFLNATTKPMRLSLNTFEVDGRQIPTSSLHRVELNDWTENLVIEDASGQKVFSTASLGILSLGLFINTLDYVIEQRA